MIKKREQQMEAGISHPDDEEEGMKKHEKKKRKMNRGHKNDEMHPQVKRVPDKDEEKYWKSKSKKDRNVKKRKKAAQRNKRKKKKSKRLNRNGKINKAVPGSEKSNDHGGNEDDHKTKKIKQPLGGEH